MNYSSFSNLVEHCDGVDVRSVSYKDINGLPATRKELFQVGKVKPPQDVFVEVRATSTKGTIGRVVGIETDKIKPGKFSEVRKLYIWSGTYIIEIDGRQKPARISSYHANILKDHDGTTKWVRNVKKKPAVVTTIPLHVNKYKQTINMGDWVVGLMPKRHIAFGKVVRQSANSIWVEIPKENGNAKTFCITTPYESFVLPAPNGDEYDRHIMMSVLAGWNGNQK